MNFYEIAIIISAKMNENGSRKSADLPATILKIENQQPEEKRQMGVAGLAANTADNLKTVGKRLLQTLFRSKKKEPAV